ncbi:MAG: hypothetical protein D6752_03160 [Candidatus Nitrosothermus koennekii]|nr:MAG: hypothetical protein D6752_03160 [Candidatus Nitrosothermus koennekii]
MKINLPRKFKLHTNDMITLRKEDIERYSTIFYLHVPNKDEVYKAFINKGFNLLHKNGYYHLTKNIDSLLMDVKIYDDGFIEASIGIKNQMVNVIYQAYDYYRDVYDGLHIFYKTEWDNRKGWVIDIKEYFRIELPKADEIPWKPRIIEIPSGFLGRFKLK